MQRDEMKSASSLYVHNTTREGSRKGKPDQQSFIGGMSCSGAQAGRRGAGRQGAEIVNVSQSDGQDRSQEQAQRQAAGPTFAATVRLLGPALQPAIHPDAEGP